MAIKPTTTKQMISRSQILGETLSSTSYWFRMLKARAQALASDGDHTFTYRERDALTKSTTRQQIVDIYETAYSELAESFHGHLERIGELDSELARVMNTRDHTHADLLAANNRIDKLNRRIEGFLNVIESPRYDTGPAYE